MKYIGQILASIIYTCIFTGIMYLVITIPLAFIISLPWWGILLFILFGAGILEFIIQLLCSFGVIPYLWIVKRNNVALCISIGLILFNVLSNIYRIWSFIGGGTWGIVFGVVSTIILLHFIYKAIFGILSVRDCDDK